MSEFYADTTNQPDVRGSTDPKDKAVCHLNSSTDHIWSEPIYPIHPSSAALKTIGQASIRRVCIYCGASQYKDSLPTSAHYGKWCYYEHKYEKSGCVDYPGNCGAY